MNIKDKILGKRISGIFNALNISARPVLHYLLQYQRKPCK